MHYKKKNKKPELQDIVYGPHAIIELLKAKKRRLLTLYTTKSLPKSWGRIKQYLPKDMKKIQYVSREVLTKMAGTTDHSGIVALTKPFVYTSKMFDPKKHPFILLLDGVQDVRNLGAILRSAYCTGVSGVVLCKKGGAEITATVLKTSAGLAEHLSIYKASSISAAVQEIKKAGYTLYMSVPKNGTSITDMKYDQHKCLVIGNEATGISQEIQRSGVLITIPQRAPDISYNASVAAGILLFSLSQN